MKNKEKCCRNLLLNGLFFCTSWKFGSFGYNRNRTERTEPEVSRFLALERTERFLFSRNRSSSRTEEPNRLVRLEPNAQDYAPQQRIVPLTITPRPAGPAAAGSVSLAYHPSDHHPCSSTGLMLINPSSIRLTFSGSTSYRWKDGSRSNGVLAIYCLRLD